jgi:2-(1,2-epoxy-1,2-dihydrophenyl)acetyl-CoA isomerase
LSLLLPRMIGYARAIELCMLSDKIDAERARSFGLVTEIVAFEDVVARAQSFAAQLAAGPKSLGLIKRELVRNALGDVAAALAYEAEIQSIAGETADAREGITAFTQKRAPHFAGR